MHNIDEPTNASATGAHVADPEKAFQRTTSGSSYSQEKDKALVDPPYIHRVDKDIEEDRAKKSAFWHKYRPFLLTGIALVILGWWISSIVLKATRHRW